MNKTILYFWLILASIQQVHAQGDDDRTDAFLLQKVSVPSPTVAGIAKFTDVPVSYATGAPDISIPLYTINTGKLSWPITLAYNSSGVKVTDNSGNVGLSWNINAEGAIIQNVLGEKDNGSYQSAGGLTWTNASLLPNTSTNWSLLNNLSNQTIDGAPDLYMYNFGGQSGRFIVADEVRLMPRKNIVVSSFLSAGQKCWKIVDESGISCYFMDMETVQTRTTNANPNYNNWLLTKVVDANNVDSIVFEYENSFVELPVFKSYEINTWRDTAGAGNWTVGMEPNDAQIPGTVTYYMQQTTGKQLKRILFNNGSVEYDIAWNDREDVTTSGSTAYHVPRIKNLLVKDKTGTIIKTVHFEHDYFLSPGVTGINGKRLRLSSVTFAHFPSDINDPGVQRYTFVYNTTTLPSKQSSAMDHWGYYNGAGGNQGLIPTINTLGLHYYGADRNTNPSYFDAGMLEQVNYPTGGYAKYHWQPHSRVLPGAGYYLATTDSTINKYLLYEGQSGQLHTLESESVTIPDNDTFTTMHATLVAWAGFPEGATDYSKIHAASSVLLYEITGNNATLIRTLTIGEGPYTKSADVILHRGKTYYFKVQSQGSFGCTVTGALHMEWPYLAYAGGSQQLIGGCRIGQIELFDPMSNKTITKKYQYSNTSLYRAPVYYRKIYKYIDPYQGTDEVVGVHICEDYEVTGLFLSSNSFNITGAGSEVGYDEVRESIGANGEGGMIIYNYKNFGETVGEVNASWRRGLLNRVRVYNKAGTLLHETFYTLKNDMAAHFAGHTATASGMHPCADANNTSLFPSHFVQKTYDFPVDWIYTDTVSKKDYVTGIQSIQAMGYDNDQHMLPTRSTTFTSDGSKVTTFTKYPTDFTLTGTPTAPDAFALQALQNKHVNNIPIERYTQKWLSGSSSPITIGASYSEFRTPLSYPDIVLLSSQYSLNQNEGLTDFQPMNISLGNAISKDNRYSLKATANEYDKRTNMVTLSTEGNQFNSSIWGYNQTFSIAEVNNNRYYKYIGFSSFEKNATGNWTYPESAVTASEKLTGERCLDLTVSPANIDFTTTSNMLYGTTTPAVQGKYIVSYWRKSGSVTVNGTSPTLTGMTANGWTYCEHVLINPSAVAVNGNTKIDELRFYPAEANMTSFTYNPLIGITSADNGSSNIILYEYDDMGRVKIERDIFGKIIKQYSYQYQVTE
jgi:hypothetical protein